MTNGKLILFSAPSGAGKTTLVKHILPLFPSLEFSVSACSRAIRPNEKDGIDYYFLTPDQFKQKIEAQAFIEWEEVYPNSFYGTLKSELSRIWKKGNHVVFDVDVMGGKNLKMLFGDRALAIFIMPPNIETLKLRLAQRGSESVESLAKRVEKASIEMQSAPAFDKIIINDNLELAKKEAEDLIRTFIG